MFNRVGAFFSAAASFFSALGALSGKEILVLFANILLMIVGIFYSIILHEIGHGFAAHMNGDDTAKEAGRLSLNPVKHIDPVGTIVLPLVLSILGLPVFGWAKPVPVNPYKFNRKSAMTTVSLAGVFMNLVIAIVMFTAYSLFMKSGHYAPFADAAAATYQVFPSPGALIQIGGINLMLLVFNMLPFPPLDGYNFLVSILPKKAAAWLVKNQTILYLILVVLLVSGLLVYIYLPILKAVLRVFQLIFHF